MCRFGFRLRWKTQRCLRRGQYSKRLWRCAAGRPEVDPFWKAVVWHQFGAAIEMLENAIRACPDAVWSDPSKKPEWVERSVPGFWYVAFHTLFFLDYYLSDPHLSD